MAFRLAGSLSFVLRRLVPVAFRFLPLAYCRRLCRSRSSVGGGRLLCAGNSQRIACPHTQLGGRRLEEVKRHAPGDRAGGWQRQFSAPVLLGSKAISCGASHDPGILPFLSPNYVPMLPTSPHARWYRQAGHHQSSLPCPVQELLSWFLRSCFYLSPLCPHRAARKLIPKGNLPCVTPARKTPPGLPRAAELKSGLPSTAHRPRSLGESELTARFH